ncbi:hypothetical protein LVY74_02305 [Acinetobacter sp. ME22]|uniref:hypothetical protein n=1 Tax=Acinetobacter sp. ME22 TaxID=2904802 RepID=UPI001EDBBEB2|nr:hypothetical protein [Acinetobacter sp. ME22]MCG2572390.1 hypothetical protein [Acinetobacter sp. ME22]
MDLGLFEKQYNVLNYHCVHFVIDAAKALLHQDYSSSFMGLTGALNQAITTSRQTVIKNKRLKQPQHGCIVLMTSLTGDNHVGLFYGGKVLHLSEGGVQYVHLRALNIHYLRFRYYEHVQNL